ncbi:hypothetical protein GCM10011514_21680 [Emticicia aquatilis]|uniref:Uncharacterized protein n=2 Tax=Emticicia aquatilis TaxID=1537369 RepID=A0A916YR95_9BACT|nr:hypothetical protein GCM10011514_21680 [Emticicia aquatilis]
MLIPRVTAPNTSITSPSAGMVVYDQSNSNLAYYNGANWSNLTGTTGNQGLYSRFPNSKSFVTYYKSTSVSAPTTEDFDFVVPAGVSKVWVEAWGGGGAGSSAVLNPYGGEGGDFASFLIDVTAGTTMWIKVSKGGYTSTSYSNTFIYPNKSNLGNYVPVGKSSYGLFKAFGSITPELITFQGGEPLMYSSASFQVYNGVNVIVFSEAVGGGTYPSYTRTKSNTFVFNSSSNAYITTFGSNYYGYIPGGGAPAASESYGGPGLVIIHW